MDSKLVQEVQAAAPAFDVDAIIKSAEDAQFYESRKVWPVAFMSNGNRKRRAAREHNERYEAAKRGEPFPTDDVGPRGDATQEYADSLGEALGHLYLETAQHVR